MEGGELSLCFVRGGEGRGDRPPSKKPVANRGGRGWVVSSVMVTAYIEP